MGIDDVVEIAEVVKRAEEIGPDLETQIKKGVYDDTVNWIQTCLPERIKRAYPVKNQEHAVQIAKVQAELSQALALVQALNSDRRVANIIGLDQGERGNLWQLLFSDTEGSVATCCNTRKSDVSEDIRDEFAGAISNLTLIQLISESDPNLAPRARIFDVLVRPRVDVRDQYDLKFDFGDTNSKGEKIIRVLSLKSHRYDDARIIEVTTDSSNTLGVERTSIDTMLTAAKKLQNRLDRDEKINGGVGVEVRCYVGLVPRFDAPCVMNPVGQISSHSLPEIRNYFKKDARKCGFLPARKEM